MKEIPLRQAPSYVMFAILIMQLASCGFVYDENLTGSYRLVAIDVIEDMSICYSLENGVYQDTQRSEVWRNEQDRCR